MKATDRIRRKPSLLEQLTAQPVDGYGILVLPRRRSLVPYGCDGDLVTSFGKGFGEQLNLTFGAADERGVKVTRKDDL